MHHLLNIQEPLKKELVVGIDFGTTYSVLAFVSNKILSYNKINQKSIENIPNISISSITKYNGFQISSVKRLLAKNLKEINNLLSVPSYIKDIVIEKNKQIKFKISSKNVNKFINVVEVASSIFGKLKQKTKNKFGITITKAVVTVPAYFDNNAKAAVRQAATISGVEVIRLIAEPTAAAYAYGLNKKAGTYLAYDLGGGTFDLSLVNLQQGILKVIEVSGDNELGGDNIDYELARYLQKLSNIKTINQKILDISRNIKEQFSTKEIVITNINSKKISITKEKFNQLIQHIIKKTIYLTKNLLKNKEKPDGIILVGGSTKITKLQEELSKTFKLPLIKDINPDKVVAYGAALQAMNLTTKNKKDLLIDVVGLSLGIELMGGIVEKIIERNTPIPFTVKRNFTTYVDYQSAIKIHILQGEREFAKDCRSLAQFELKNLPPKKAGLVKIEVIFSIDADSLLSVTATELSTNIHYQVDVHPTYGLSEKQQEKMLLQAMELAESDIRAKILRENIQKSERFLNKLLEAMSTAPELLETKESEKINLLIKDLKKFILQKDNDNIVNTQKILSKKTEKLVKDFFNLGVHNLLVGKKIE